MTEREYINASDLTMLRAANFILRDISPDGSPVINREDFYLILNKIDQWMSDLYSTIEISKQK